MLILAELATPLLSPVEHTTCPPIRFSFIKYLLFARTFSLIYTCTQRTFLYSLSISYIFSRLINFHFVIVAVKLLTTLFVLLEPCFLRAFFYFSLHSFTCLFHMVCKWQDFAQFLNDKSRTNLTTIVLTPQFTVVSQILRTLYMSFLS